MDLVQIDDPADPRLADYVGLTDSVRRSRSEPAAGFFIAEGTLVLRRAVEAGCVARSLLLAPGRLAAVGLDVQELGCPVYVASAEVLHAVTGFHVHRGVLAAFGRPDLPAVGDLLAASRRVLVLEEINNATNLGAVFRSAAGLGMDAVLLSPQCCDPLYRRAVRVSMGEVLAVPYAYLQPWPASLDRLRAAGFRLLALTPSPLARPLDELHVDPDERIAVLLGAEGAGLREQTLSRTDIRVRIPMSAGVDSLNVAAAAAIACWAVGRRA